MLRVHVSPAFALVLVCILSCTLVLFLFALLLVSTFSFFESHDVGTVMVAFVVTFLALWFVLAVGALPGRCWVFMFSV